MPCAHERSISNVGKVADGKNCALSKRSLDKNNDKCRSKERQLSTLVMRNSEQRCFILTLVPLELNELWKFLASLPVQGPEQRNQLGSGTHIDMDGLQSVSLPTVIVFQVDLQNEQRINPPDYIGSVKSCTASSSSGANVLGQSRNRNKRTKSVKNSSSIRPSCFVPGNSSSSVCDGSDAVSSDILVNDVPKVDKPVKRCSRKKGKKKGKQYKRSLCKKVPIEIETECAESICDGSILEPLNGNDPACSGEYISENNLTGKSTSPSLLVQDLTMAKDDNKKEVNGGYINHSATPVTYNSYNDEMDESEPIGSFPQVCAGEGFSCTRSSIDGGFTHLTYTSSSTRTPEIILSTYNESPTSAPPEQSSNCDDNYSNISLDQHNSPMTDSDTSENCSDNVETRSSIKDDSRLNHSEGGSVSDSRSSGTSFHSVTLDSCDIDTESFSDCYRTSPFCSKDVVDTCTERAQCSSQACSSNDFHLVIPGKRGRQGRKVSGSSNAAHRFGSSNVHGRIGKDNNHSVWQKVQRNDTECVFDQKHANPISSQFSSKGSETKVKYDILGGKQKESVKSCSVPCLDDMDAQIVQTDSFKEASYSIDSSELLPKHINGCLINNVPEKLKRKPSSASKQDNFYSRKGPLAGKTNMAKPSKIHVQHNKEGSEILPEVNYQKRISPASRSACATDFRRVVTPSDKIECYRLEPQQETPIHMEGSTSSGKNCNMIGDRVAQNQIGPLPIMLDSLDEMHIETYPNCSNDKFYKDMHEAPCLLADSEGNRCMKSETGSSLAENSKLDNSPGLLLQKWVPVGRKDSVVFRTSQTNDSAVSIVDGSVDSVPDRCNSKNSEVELLSPDSHRLDPLTGSGVACLSPSSYSNDHPSPECDEPTTQLRSHPHTSGEVGGVHDVSNCHLTHGVQDQCFAEIETDLDKIIEAVSDSYRLHTASEGIRLVTGSPIAEFERLLYSATPVIDEGNCVRACKICSRDKLIGDPLCQHQIPKISLGSLWQWYEKPGSYGLEVKAEDYHNSKRLGNGRSEFRAYFVPYLSAVQLFGRSRSFKCTSNDDSNREVMEACEVDRTSSSSSSLGSLSIFSVLLPKPHKEADTCMLESSLSAKDEFCNQSGRSIHLGDEELLFEYFDSDHPQQRRPLFEKIKELVKGDPFPNCHTFGDPSKLECANLHDLHPASWYSVAWYPIYRIPDGNFRTAFLTYHSLGHFVHRGASSNMPGDLNHIISPVVGLQSYNAKGDCWFQLRDPKFKVVQTEEAKSLNPSEILKERLQTLEKTALVMARASVRKGSLKSVNRQSDFEFFLSRRR